jgi:hypothetical protein
MGTTLSPIGSGGTRMVAPISPGAGVIASVPPCPGETWGTTRLCVGA